MAMDQRKPNSDEIQIRLRGEIVASVSIYNVNDDVAQSRTTPVLIDKMSVEGLEFQTYLRFPVNADYSIRIEMVMGQWQLTLLGHVVWRRKSENLYTYGCSFVPDAYMSKAIKVALQSHVKQRHPGYLSIHRLYERMSGIAAVPATYKFDQKG